MVVFDASGSMGGTDLNSVTPRIAKVRTALAVVLPEVAPVRPIGLIVYGPGASNKCESVELRLRPSLDAAETIMTEVDNIVPAGRTPLTAAVSQAAEVLDYKTKPATIVLITDGEETCGGQPCNSAGLLKAQAKDLTIHVIGYRDKLATTGPFGSRCMADISGGTYVSVETTEQLTEALRATLGCPYVTQAPRPAQTRITWGLITSP
jgi:Ca-activated chloride channel family protein